MNKMTKYIKVTRDARFEGSVAIVHVHWFSGFV